MDKKTRCIVLRTVKYGDNKLIVDFLSREEGRLSTAYKITSSARSRARRQCFQPLTILDIDFSRAERQTMITLHNVRMAEIYSSIPFDAAKMSLAFFIAEFLTYATRDVHPDATLYDYIERSMLWLDTAERGIANFHLMFMMHISQFLGFQPNMDSYREGAFFDMQEGRFCVTAPLHRHYLAPAEAEQMSLLMRMAPSNLHLFKLSRAERNHITDLVLSYYHLHIPAFGDIKSLEVLRAM